MRVDAPMDVDAALRLARARLADWRFAEVAPIEAGWDSVVLAVDGSWIVRIPRRPDVRRWVAAEAALLPALAPCLPVPVPRFERVAADGDGVDLVAYRRLDGIPADRALADPAAAPALAAAIGAFLAALHRFPHRHRLPPGFGRRRAWRWLDHQLAFRDRCLAEVCPLLDPDERAQATRMFEAFLARAGEFQLSLIHGDLGPEHLLCAGDAVGGVIDWSDAHVGDPALDFGWLLFGSPPDVADALLRAYDRAGGAVDPGLRARARFYHAVGPWHEVVYGLQEGRPELVASGLAGVRRRLPCGQPSA